MLEVVAARSSREEGVCRTPVADPLDQRRIPVE
jgi:hypothetical protein